jgi:hypothetical protein
MQMSQLFRRGILRPIDDTAANELSSFHITQPILVEWLPIPSDGQFQLIWDSGLFQRINEACGLAISDFEEVELPWNRIRDAIQAAQLSRSQDPHVRAFAVMTTSLLERAWQSEHSVFFVL